MSKSDMLLKKATSFERLALYSDRNSFLKALTARQLTDEDQLLDETSLEALEAIYLENK